MKIQLVEKWQEIVVKRPFNTLLRFPNKGAVTTLQMFAGIYRDFAGKSDCGDFKFTGIACIPAIPVIFEVNQKESVDFLYTHCIKIFQISL